MKGNVYFFIGFFILVLIIILSIVNLITLKKNTSFNTSAKLKTAYQWNIFVVVTSILLLLLLLTDYFILRHYQARTNSYITVLMLCIFADFALLIFSVISMVNTANIYSIADAILSFTMLIILIIIFYQTRSIPYYINPTSEIVTTNAVLPEPVVVTPTEIPPQFYETSLITIADFS